MPTMSNYCKAYPAGRLRDFRDWCERVPPLTVTAGETGAGSGEHASQPAEPQTEEYYYVHDNYVVTAGVFVDQDVAFDEVTDEWKRFCHERLEFEVPPEVRELENEPAAAPSR